MRVNRQKKLRGGRIDSIMALSLSALSSRPKGAVEGLRANSYDYE